VGEAVVDNIIRPIQAKFNELSDNADYLDGIIKNNAEKAGSIGQKILKKVKKKVGFVV
jgi:tryptophanyl-tRNA synthetase